MRNLIFMMGIPVLVHLDTENTPLWSPKTRWKNLMRTTKGEQENNSKLKLEATKVEQEYNSKLQLYTQYKNSLLSSE